MNNKKPVVEVRTVGESDDSSWSYWEEVEYYVNDEKVAEGFYGGEPEDNLRYRTYKWVDEAFKAVIEKLGVEVKFTRILKEEEDE